MLQTINLTVIKAFSLQTGRHLCFKVLQSTKHVIKRWKAEAVYVLLITWIRKCFSTKVAKSLLYYLLSGVKITAFVCNCGHVIFVVHPLAHANVIISKKLKVDNWNWATFHIHKTRLHCMFQSGCYKIWQITPIYCDCHTVWLADSFCRR